MLILETERMQLIALSREQLNLCLTNLQQLGEELNIQITPEAFSDDSRQAIGIKSTRMLMVETHLHPWYTYFLMVRKEDRRAMGVAGFKGAPTPYGSVELGYAIQQDYRNQGYMTEAVHRLIEWAFLHEACHRVTAETLRDNLASQHVLTKNGLTLARDLQNMLYWEIDREKYHHQE